MNKQVERKLGSSHQEVQVNHAHFSWNQDGSDMKMFGVESILFWIKPSLKSLLSPLCEELGEDLYSRLIAFESSKGTYEDYHSMVSVLGHSFEEGFLKWGSAVSACGWGQFSIKEMDWEKKRAVIRIDRPWELSCYNPKRKQNNIPFLAGKISGIFSHAFTANCRAEILLVEHSDSQSYVVLEVRPSLETLEDSLMKIKNENGNDLRAINNALRRSQRRFLDVIETTDEFIFEAAPCLTISYATDKAAQILDVNKENVVGMSWKDLLSVEEAQKLQTLLGTLSEEKKFVESEFVMKRPGKADRWLYLRVKRMMDFSDNHVGFVGAAREITMIKDLQNRLDDQKKNAEYSAKMATLGEMAGGVAHEINTPLAVISLLSEQLLEDLPELHFDMTRSRKSLEQILATTERISKIIQGLRTFARDAAQDPLFEVPLMSIYNETLILCQNRMKHHGVSLRIAAVDPDLKIKCRSTQISQVLINLLNNAFDAVQELPEKWIDVRTQICENYVEIRVSDSGRGIPAAIRQKLMQPFFTTKPVGKGTGLGLSISKGIIDSHAGLFYIDEKDPHTCFVIRLPL